MKEFGSQARYHCSSIPDEIESLQTDVMRFMAIIGICLMVIFALVQSLPSNSAATLEKQAASAYVDSMNSLKDETSHLQESLDRSEEELMVMYEQLDEFQIMMSGLKNSKEAIANLDDQKIRQQVEASTYRKELEQLQQKIIDAEAKHALQQKQITNTGGIVTQLQDEIFTKTKQINKLGTKIEQQEKRVELLKSAAKEQEDAIRELNEQLNKEKIAQTVSPTAPSKKVPDSRPAPKSTKEGFTLRFASDTALFTLVNKKQVILYVTVDGRSWKLRPNAQSAEFIKSGPPGRLYAMNSDTVPANYRMIFSKSDGAGLLAKASWGVTLPNHLSRQVGTIMQENSGGDLVIDERGTLSLNRG